MTSVNVTTQKNTVTVQEGDTTIVTVTTQGPQGATGAAGAGISAGDKGALTVAANLTDWTLNDSVVTNAKVSASAAIAGTKISPDFGSQNITTTGNAVFGAGLDVTGGITTTNGSITQSNSGGTENSFGTNINISTVYPSLHLNDTNSENDFKLQNQNGVFAINDGDANANRLTIASDGTTTITQNLNVGGNLTVSGTTTTIDTTTLRVEDKNIELGKVGSPTDITADGGGITLLGDTNHTFNWINATDSWTSSEHIALPDNKKLQLGDSQDLAIFRNSTDSFIENAAGNLHIRPKAGEEGIKLVPDAQCELYFNNVKVFETTATGTIINGTHVDLGATHFGDVLFYADNYNIFFDKSESSFVFSDNAKANFGSSADLSILHNGTDSKITNITGNLLIEAKAGETGIKVIPDGAVELYYNNVKKAETTADGFNILSGATNVGALIASGSSISSHAYGHGINGFLNQGLTIRAEESCLELISTDGGQHAGSILIRDSSNDGFGFVNDPTNEELQLKSFTTSNNNFLISSTGTNVSRLDNCIVIKKDGGVQLFYDNEKRAETLSTSFNIFGKAYVTGEIASLNCRFLQAGTDLFIDNNNGGSANRYTQISGGTLGTSSGLIKLYNAGQVELFHSSTKVAETTSRGLNVTSATNPHLLVTSDENLNEHAYQSVRNGVTIKSSEARLDLIANGNGTHAGSFLMRDNSHDGFGFVNDFTNKEFQLKSFTSSGIAFSINSTGSNVSRLDNCIVIKKDGSVSLFNDGVRTFETKNYGFVSEAFQIDPNILVHKVGHSRGGLAALQTQRLALATTTSGDDIVFGFGSAEPITSSNFTERLRIDNGTGNVGINNSSPAKKLDVTGTIRASTGILFGSDTADANTLDDYEEGTFTPTLEGSSGNPTVTYNTQLGHYTKIGNVVHIQLVIVTTSYTGGGGEWQCGGLPFTASSSATASFNFNWNQNNKVNWGANVLSLAPYIAAGTTRIRARKFMSDANTALNLSGFSNSETMVFGVHGSYIAA